MATPTEYRSRAGIAGRRLPVRLAKALGDKGWKNLERDELDKTDPQYVAQVVIYQAYLGVTDHPAIFAATNSNSMARVHLLHEFDAEPAQARRSSPTK